MAPVPDIRSHAGAVSRECPREHEGKVSARPSRALCLSRSLNAGRGGCFASATGSRRGRRPGSSDGRAGAVSAQSLGGDSVTSPERPEGERWVRRFGRQRDLRIAHRREVDACAGRPYPERLPHTRRGEARRRRVLVPEFVLKGSGDQLGPGAIVMYGSHTSVSRCWRRGVLSSRTSANGTSGRSRSLLLAQRGSRLPPAALSPLPQLRGQSPAALCRLDRSRICGEQARRKRWVSTTHWKNCTGDVFGRLGHQEQNCRRYVFRAPEATRWCCGESELDDHGILSQLSVHRCLDPTRGDGVYPHAVRSELDGERPGQLCECGFAHSIRSCVRLSDLSRGRYEIHDRPSAFSQVWDCRLCEDKRSPDVDAPLLVQRGDRRLLDQPDLEAPRATHKNIESPESLDRLFDGVSSRSVVFEIGGNGETLCSRRLDPRGDLLEPQLVPAADRDRCPRFSKRLSNPCSDSRARA